MHRATIITVNNNCPPHLFWAITQQHALQLGGGQTHATIWADLRLDNPPTFDLYADYRLKP